MKASIWLHDGVPQESRKTRYMAGSIKLDSSPYKGFVTLYLGQGVNDTIDIFFQSEEDLVNFTTTVRDAVEELFDKMKADNPQDSDTDPQPQS